jgi:LuxR family transcriptional regulator, maltose regulon positive regulatory protein
MDAGDADLATFFYYLGLAAKNAAPRNRKPLPLLTPEYLQGIPVFAKRFFEQLAARLIGKTRLRSSSEDGNPATVFDNYQDVPEDSMFQEVINAGLSSIPQGMNVIMLSRSEPPPAYTRLRAAGEMKLLSWEDVRLTADESSAIVLLKAGRDLPCETLDKLYQTTNGWAAGLVLLLESLGMEDFDYQLSRGLPREEIFAYFAAELFDRSSRGNRTFLLETAFLPRMNARMASASRERNRKYLPCKSKHSLLIYRYDSQDIKTNH